MPQPVVSLLLYVLGGDGQEMSSVVNVGVGFVFLLAA
jgi:phosphoribosylaminoimidazole (AIR) synthetase